MDCRLTARMKACGAELAREHAAQLAAAGTLGPKQIQRRGGQVVDARLAEREAAVADLAALSLPKRRPRSQASTPPQLAMVTMDGGRCQRRDQLGTAATTTTSTHWNETKMS